MFAFRLFTTTSRTCPSEFGIGPQLNEKIPASSWKGPVAIVLVTMNGYGEYPTVKSLLMLPPCTHWMILFVSPTFQKSPAAGLINRIDGEGTTTNFGDSLVVTPSVIVIVTWFPIAFDVIAQL